jgi:anaerobic selenocysteine-containing dehydrogenase
LHMANLDVERLGLVEGDKIVVSTAFGSIESHVFVDDSLLEGVVAMAHGYGQSKTFAMRVAQQYPGSNCNDIMPSGPDSIEPLSNMSWLSAVPVTVTRCETQA